MSLQIKQQKALLRGITIFPTNLNAFIVDNVSSLLEHFTTTLLSMVCFNDSIDSITSSREKHVNKNGTWYLV